MTTGNYAYTHNTSRKRDNKIKFKKRPDYSSINTEANYYLEEDCLDLAKLPWTLHKPNTIPAYFKLSEI